MGPENGLRAIHRSILPIPLPAPRPSVRATLVAEVLALPLPLVDLASVDVLPLAPLVATRRTADLLARPALILPLNRLLMIVVGRTACLGWVLRFHLAIRFHDLFAPIY